MRILHIIHSVSPTIGGPIEGIIQLANVMQKLNHVVEIASLDPPDAHWVKQCPLRTHAQGPGKFGYGYTHRLVPWLRDHARNYNHVIINGIWQYNSFGTWLALRTESVPYFVFTHGMLDPWFKRTYRLKHLKKSLYWPWAEYQVLRDAAGVCFTCEEERLLASQSFAPYKCKEIVVHYGTAQPAGNPDAQRASFLGRFPNLKSKRLLLFLSRIHVKKGCDMLIEAFAQVADLDDALHLVMAGPDQQGWRVQLQEQATKLGIAQRITWPGMLEGDMKWGAFYAAEAFVLPSHQENFGIVVAEALARRVPVLTTNKVNIWQEIEGAGAGIIDTATVEGTVRSLRKWLTMSPLEQQVMRDQAQQCFEEHFNIERAAQSLLNLLSSPGAE